MTVYEDMVERKRTRRGSKVLVLACGILAVLGSFWGIVWFIRSYVEPPRVMAPAPLSLAARESRPAPAPTPAVDAKLPFSEPATAPQLIQIQATQAPAALPPARRTPSIESPSSAGLRIVGRPWINLPRPLRPFRRRRLWLLHQAIRLRCRL